jgi:hypothetical protein
MALFAQVRPLDPRLYTQKRRIFCIAAITLLLYSPTYQSLYAGKSKEGEGSP